MKSKKLQKRLAKAKQRQEESDSDSDISMVKGKEKWNPNYSEEQLMLADQFQRSARIEEDGELFFIDTVGDSSLQPATESSSSSPVIVLQNPSESAAASGNAVEQVEIPFLANFMHAANSKSMALVRKKQKNGEKKNKKNKKNRKQQQKTDGDSDLNSVDQDYLNNLEMGDEVPFEMIINPSDDSEDPWEQMDNVMMQMMELDEGSTSFDSDDLTEDSFDLSASESERDQKGLSKRRNKIADEMEEEILFVENFRKERRKAAKAIHNANIIRLNSNSSTSSLKGPLTRSRLRKAKEKDTDKKFREISDLLQKYLHWIGYEKSSHFNFEPMPRPVRKVFHNVVYMTGCSSKSIGKGQTRFTIVSREEGCKYPNEKQLKRISDLLERTRSSLRGWKGTEEQQAKQKKKNKRKDIQPGKAAHSKKKGQKKGAAVPEAKLKHGQIIGADSAPINEANKGHQLLMKMGWAPGQALGSTSADTALTTPLSASFRHRGRGLGFN